MICPAPRFNLILSWLLLAAAVSGCKTNSDKKSEDKKKQASAMRFHLEMNPDGTPHNEAVQIYRAHPFVVTVEREPVLEEGYIKDAEVVDTDTNGGFAIKIVFDDSGTRQLQAVTVGNKGRHLAISAQWTETRWLAAPLITKNISDGVFIFTPDATREESERIVNGLKNVAKKLQEPYTF